MRYIKPFIVVFLALVAGFTSCVQKPAALPRPKLVIGIVIDQMRWDYLYRFYNLYGNDGFKRLMSGGYNCQNTMVNYLPSFTGPGHTCIYTGSVPAIHGISGNNWIDDTGRNWYCVEDADAKRYSDVISSGRSIPMSPNSLLVTTITDELRLGTNFRSRVFGIAIKDRGSILPAGHLGNAAYYYNDSVFTTSKYYTEKYQNPAWLQAFNNRKLPDSLSHQHWQQYLADNSSYDLYSVVTGSYGKGFSNEVQLPKPPYLHMLDTTNPAGMRTALKTMPAGNTYTLMMARACIEGEQLGQNGNTDFLAVSLSSTDYAGHQFGPNAKELEDMYLHLDNQIALMLKYLDETMGKDNYLLFLTADHGGAHNATFLQDNNIPAGVANFGLNQQSKINALIKKDFYATDALRKNATDAYKKNGDTLYKIVNITNYQAFLNSKLINNLGLDRNKIKDEVIDFLKKEQHVSFVTDMDNIDKTPLPEPLRTMLINGYNNRRSGCIAYILDPAWYDYNIPTGTTHGTWNPYDAHIPLLWYGWHIPQGETNDLVNMTDISPTLAALLHIQSPNGCIGKPIKEITDNKCVKKPSGAER